MNPWWSQARIELWGPTMFHSVFWPLTCLGAWAARPPRLKAAPLWTGIAIGLVLIAAGLVALAVGQPGYVWGRLLLCGGLFETIHTSLLVAMVLTRREVGPAQTGGVS